MRMKFIKEMSDNDPTEVTFITENVSLDAVLDDFTEFLRASGFAIDYSKQLEVVPIDGSKE